MSANSSQEKSSMFRKCLCPFCEEALVEAEPLFCQPCGLALRRCSKCLTVVAKEATVCPQCGTAIE
ncbi:MAG: zinc ribbon domain-containing protein [Chloroflexi bacterium]|nr:zinc ribbon domain-containing protein [Chloroflexota bacterium]